MLPEPVAFSWKCLISLCWRRGLFLLVGTIPPLSRLMKARSVVQWSGLHSRGSDHNGSLGSDVLRPRTGDVKALVSLNVVSQYFSVYSL